MRFSVRLSLSDGLSAGHAGVFPPRWEIFPIADLTHQTAERTRVSWDVWREGPA